MQNLREYLKQGNPDGEYQWDFMDGLDEVPEEYQEKLKTAVIQGKIADEDWKGVCIRLSYLHACLQRLTCVGSCVQRARTEGHAAQSEEGQEA